MAEVHTRNSKYKNLMMVEVHMRKYKNLTMGSHEEFEVQAPDDGMGSHVEVPETDNGRGSHEVVQDGEAANIDVSTFESKPNWNNIRNKKDIRIASSSEKQLCQRLYMVEVVGKNRRKVPVILTINVKNAKIVLNNTRKEAKVSQYNEHVFAVNDGKSVNPLRCHDALKNACKNVKLERPDLMRSTNLRKYVATVGQLVDINESEMGWLANHLGHNIHVHKEYYRLPQSTLERTVVGNLLMAVVERRAHQFKGKNPREITLADFEDGMGRTGDMQQY
ncbi:hypothetical protein CGI_10009146, partial [Paramuricea clavata]